jgi:hypothetical protein
MAASLKFLASSAPVSLGQPATGVAAPMWSPFPPLQAQAIPIYQDTESLSSSEPDHSRQDGLELSEPGDITDQWADPQSAVVPSLLSSPRQVAPAGGSIVFRSPPPVGDGEATPPAGPTWTGEGSTLPAEVSLEKKRTAMWMVFLPLAAAGAGAALASTQTKKGKYIAGAAALAGGAVVAAAYLVKE